mgnify:CR=1 FL=1
MRDEAYATESSWEIDVNSDLTDNALGSCLVFGSEVGPFEVDGDIVYSFNLQPMTMPLVSIPEISLVDALLMIDDISFVLEIDDTTEIELVS